MTTPSSRSFTGAVLSRSVARALGGAWRVDPPRFDLDADELAVVGPYLQGYGGAELLWRRIATGPLASATPGPALQEAYRYAAVHVPLHESEIERVFQVLHGEGIRAVLVKGWGVARHFPDPALRPYVDIDLFVDPADEARAQSVLTANDCEKYFVELHAGPKHLDDQPIEDWFARAERVTLGQAEIMVPALEDQFRVLCVHWLHHGAVRAAGLCDIALFLEKFGATMDWNLCLRGSPQRISWITAAAGLADSLLGADLSATPLARSAEQLPRWLVPTVLRIWADPRGRGAVIPPPLGGSLRNPARALRELRGRFPPNPLHATLEVNGMFNSWPRWPYQAANFLARTVRFLAQLPRIMFARSAS
jgi:hypothetical protein